jgi:hypothetical protein
MATTPESKFSQRVRTSLLNCDIERLENRVNLGLPDMLIGINSRFVVVELKVVIRGLKVGLRPHQIAFMVRNAAAGRPCFILVKREGSLLVPSTISLYAGKDAIELAQQGLRLAPMASWPSRAMDWSKLRQLLALA